MTSTFGQGIGSLAIEWGLANPYQNVTDGQYGIGNARVLGALQTIVDATTPEPGYILSFASDGTAGTSFDQKRIIVTAKPLMGVRRTDIHDAFLITAGMVCHEVAHVRYGQDTAEAVRVKWNNHQVADAISNILDDVRIEKRFSEDFAGVGRLVFRKAAAWVARDNHTGVTLTKFPTNVPDAFSVLIGATRYEEFMNWEVTAQMDATRRMLREWADKYTADDTVALHLAGVEYILDWLRSFLPDVDTADPGLDEPEPPEGPGGCEIGPSTPSAKQPPIDMTLPGEKPKEPKPGQGEGKGEPTGEGKGEGKSEPKGEDKGEGKFEGKGEPKGEGKGESEGKGERPSDKPTPSDAKGGNSRKGGKVDPLAAIDPKADPSFDEAIKGKDDPAAQHAQRIAEKTLRSTLTKGDALDRTSLVLYRDGYGTYYNRNTGEAQPGDAEALANAFNSTKYTPSEYEPGHAYGRLRARDAWKAARGQQDVFSRRLSAGDTSVHLVLVLDWSGSMAMTDGRARRVDRLVCAIAEGLAPVHSFRMTAYQYNGAVWRVWGSGDPIAPEDALRGTAAPTGGTPTGDALDLVMTEEWQNLRPDERLLICSITDGSPDDDARVARVVNHWRERGVGILGVNVSNEDASAYNPHENYDAIVEQYGEEAGLMFNGNILDLADNLTDKVGHVLQGALVGV